MLLGMMKLRIFNMESMHAIHSTSIACVMVMLATASLHAQWTHTNGPYGGGAYCFVATDSGIFAGTLNGGVLLSTDNGTTWAAAGAGVPSAAPIRALAAKRPRSGSGATLFAGTAQNLDTLINDCVYRSTNNGRSWIATGRIAPGENFSVSSLAVSGQNVLAATTAGTFLSTNDGTAWTRVNTSTIYGGVNVFVVSGPYLFAGSGGVILSTDDGVTWTTDTSGLANLGVISLALGPTRGRSGPSIIAGTVGGGLFLSTNNGANWSAVHTDWATTDVSALAISDSNLIVGTYGRGIFLSTDGGTYWSSVLTGQTSAFVHAFAVGPASTGSSTHLLAGTDGDVFLSTNDGASWAPSSTGLPYVDVQSIAVSDANLFVGTTDRGVYRSTDSGTRWTAVNAGLTNSDVHAFAAFPNSKGSGANLFAGTFGGGVFLTTDNGGRWSPVNAGLTDYNVLSLAVAGPTLFAGTTDGVYRSFNGGWTWTASSSGLAPNAWIWSIAASGRNLFAGAYGVFLSTDNGAGWTPTITGLYPYMQVWALALTPSSSGSAANLFAGGPVEGVYSSSDNGENWTWANTGLTNADVLSLAVVGRDLLAGTGGGVFLSTDNGASWTSVSSGLPSTYVNALALSDTFVVAATSCCGAWRRPLSEIFGSVSHAPKITPDRSIVDFMNVPPGESSDTVQIAISNSGLTALTITSIRKSRSEYVVINSPALPAELLPFGQLNLAVAFRPLLPGTIVNDTILVSSNDPSNPVEHIVLKGRGVGAIVPAQAGMLYSVSASSSGTRLMSIDKRTGQSALVTDVSPHPPPAIGCLSVRRADNVIYAASSSPSMTTLYRISAQYGDLERVVTIPLGNLTAMAFSPGDTLYMCDANGRIYGMKGVNGSTFIADSANHQFSSFTFSPSTGNLWGLAHDTLYTVNLAAREASPIGTPALGVVHSSIAFGPVGTLYALLDNTLVALDRSNAQPYNIGSTGRNDLQLIAMRSDIEGGVDPDGEVAQNFKLSQNYPNPFNPSTDIEYSVQSAGLVTLKVYDVLGREVAVLANERRAPGKYRVRFEGGRLASGVYLCRFTAGKYVETRKMLLVR